MTTRELTVWDWVVLVARLVLGGAFIALGVVSLFVLVFTFLPRS